MATEGKSVSNSRSLRNIHWVSEFIVQPTLFATQTRKITEITKNKQRDAQLIYSRDVTCNWNCHI